MPNSEIGKRLSSTWLPPLILLAGMLLSVLSAPPACARIILVQGDMKTGVVTVDSRSIHVPPGVRQLRVLVPEYPTFDAGPNAQQVISCQTTFSVPPTVSRSLVDAYGNRYTDATWDSPPAGIIFQQTDAKVKLSLHASPWKAAAAFPVVRASLPTGVLPYLAATALVQSDDPAIRVVAAQIADRKDLHSEQAVVDAVVSWVIDHLHYAPDRNVYDALSTLRSGTGECTGYSHLTMAILRDLGIPARFAAGIVFRSPYTVMGSGKFYTVDGEDNRGYLYHAWIQVYFPGEGWVEYDPQGDFGLVDTRRVLFAVAPDKASLPEGRTITTFDAMADASLFYEDNSVQVAMSSDLVTLEAQNVVQRGPLKAGTYLARAAG